tara:strand:+ start:1250 stop:1519 length:270 start_codon:yes stop_codon:yes gene_type:complete
MKYIVGASIGGLFGFSVPLVIEAHELNKHNEVPRVEDSQPVEHQAPAISSENVQYLPDDICKYIEYDSSDPKQQAKECLKVEIPAIPAI